MMAVRRLSRNSPAATQQQQQQQQQQQPVTKRRGRRRQQAIQEQPNGLDRVFIWDIDGSLMRADIVAETPLASSVLASVTDKLSSLSKQLKQMTLKFCEENLCLNELELSDQMHIDGGSVCNPPEEETATPVTASVEPDQWPPPQQLPSIQQQNSQPQQDGHTYHQLQQSVPLHQNHNSHLHMLATNHDHNHNFHHVHHNYNHNPLNEPNQWPLPSPPPPQPTSQQTFQLQDNQPYHQAHEAEPIHHQTHLHTLATSHEHHHNFHQAHHNYNHNSLSDPSQWQTLSPPPPQQPTQQSFQIQDGQPYHHQHHHNHHHHQTHQPEPIHPNHQSHLHMLVANHDHHQNFHHDHQNHHLNLLNEPNHWVPPSPPPPQPSGQHNFQLQDSQPYHQAHQLEPIHHTHQSHLNMLVSGHHDHHHHFHHNHPNYHHNPLNESNHWPQSSPPQANQQSIDQSFQIQDSQPYHQSQQPGPMHHTHQTHLHMLAASHGHHHHTIPHESTTISNASEADHVELDVKPMQGSIPKVNKSAASTTNLRAISSTTTSSATTNNNNHNNSNNRQVSQKLSDRFYRMKTVYNQYRGGIPAIQAICCDSYKSADQQNRVISILEILDEIDHFTLDWRKHSLDCLKLISASPNCTNIIITRMPLVIALGHLVCLGFSHFFDIDQVYSSSKTSKEACIKRIKKRYGASNRCSYIIIGDKDDVDMAKKLDLPYWNTSRSDGHRQLMQLHTALKEGYLM